MGRFIVCKDSEKVQYWDTVQHFYHLIAGDLPEISRTKTHGSPVPEEDLTIGRTCLDKRFCVPLQTGNSRTSKVRLNVTIIYYVASDGFLLSCAAGIL